jgi:hypothetical protein
MADGLKMARRGEAEDVRNGLDVGVDQPIGVGFRNAEVSYVHEGLGDNGGESVYPPGHLAWNSQVPMARQKH